MNSIGLFYGEPTLDWLQSLQRVGGLTQLLRIRCSVVSCLCNEHHTFSNSGMCVFIEHYFWTQSYEAVKQACRVQFSDVAKISCAILRRFSTSVLKRLVALMMEALSTPESRSFSTRLHGAISETHLSLRESEILHSASPLQGLVG